jgi:hypothetical protein
MKVPLMPSGTESLFPGTARTKAGNFIFCGSGIYGDSTAVPNRQFRTGVVKVECTSVRPIFIRGSHWYQVPKGREIRLLLFCF